MHCQPSSNCVLLTMLPAFLLWKMICQQRCQTNKRISLAAMTLAVAAVQALILAMVRSTIDQLQADQPRLRPRWSLSSISSNNKLEWQLPVLTSWFKCQGWDLALIWVWQVFSQVIHLLLLDHRWNNILSHINAKDSIKLYINSKLTNYHKQLRPNKIYFISTFPFF